MTIEPDTKDWTWVLERPCPDCGFDAAALDRSELGDTVRGATARWVAVLARPDVRARPEPDVWSALEYGCHIRDVHRIFGDRLTMMLTEDDPRFPNWNQDDTAIEGRYAEQDPAAVTSELVAAADAVAARYDSIPDDAWQRPGRRSNGSVFTIDSLSRYHLHDVVHHLHDVRG